MERIESLDVVKITEALKEDSFIKNVNSNIIECILKNISEDVYIEGNDLFVKNTDIFESVTLDDLIDKACDSCYEKLGALKAEILENIDEFDARYATKKMYDYLSVKDEYNTLDLAFRNTKYAAKYEKVAEDMIAGINSIRQGESR